MENISIAQFIVVMLYNMEKVHAKTTKNSKICQRLPITIFQLGTNEMVKYLNFIISSRITIWKRFSAKKASFTKSNKPNL